MFNKLFGKDRKANTKNKDLPEQGDQSSNISLSEYYKSNEFKNRYSYNKVVNVSFPYTPEYTRSNKAAFDLFLETANLYKFRMETAILGVEGAFNLESITKGYNEMIDVFEWFYVAIGLGFPVNVETNMTYDYMDQMFNNALVKCAEREFEIYARGMTTYIKEGVMKQTNFMHDLVESFRMNIIECENKPKTMVKLDRINIKVETLYSERASQW